MLHVLLAVVLSNDHRFSPQVQAVRMVSFEMKRPASVRRVNIVGRFATVLTNVGGALGVEQMRHYGVPRANWCSFGAASEYMMPAAVRKPGVDPRKARFP